VLEKARPGGTSAPPALAIPAATPLAPHVAASGRIGVLLVNLGTPEGTGYWPMRRYLSEFLSDRRVIEWPRAVWLPILQAIVLSRRPQRSGRLYDTIWNRQRNESPLRTVTRAQSEKLAAELAADGRIEVDWAMRYGKPPIGERIAALKEKGCDRLLVFPLYPQYSASTTATVNDKAFEALQAMRWQPALRTVPPYYDDPAYLEALAESVEGHLATAGFEPELVVASFHGVPVSYVAKGDPYQRHCLETARLLAERLGWPAERLVTTFQSRFGPEEWLQPYTDETVRALAEQGVKRLAVLTPGFAADCLETLEEIAAQAREIFLEHGGEQFAFIPCLNDSEAGMRVIRTIALRELQGWV
jgi:protoporphyrin/coproporphyrin ferrochelatase